MNMSESFSMPFVALTIGHPARARAARPRARPRASRGSGTTKTIISRAVERGGEIESVARRFAGERDARAGSARSRAPR